MTIKLIDIKSKRTERNMSSILCNKRRLKRIGRSLIYPEGGNSRDKSTCSTTEASAFWLGHRQTTPCLCVVCLPLELET